MGVLDLLKLPSRSVGKTISDSSDPEPQIIVSAVATYQFNNGRWQRFGLHPLDNMTMLRLHDHGWDASHFLFGACH
jgi:hypothetical protein